MHQHPEQPDYSDLPAGSRIVWEKDAAGLRITIPPSGFWHDAWWDIITAVAILMPVAILLHFLWRFGVPSSVVTKNMGWGWVTFLIGGLAVAGAIQTATDRTACRIELNEQELIRTMTLWRFQWRRTWERAAIREVRRRGPVVVVCGKPGWRNGVIGGRSGAELDWIVRCLQRELLPTPPTGAENT
jgi:hypothetical protein